MAVRKEDLYESQAHVVAFPTQLVRARIARHRRIEMARRRLCAGVVVLVAVGAFLFTGGVGTSAPGSVAGAPATVVLHKGQTLWDLAERYAPERIDPRAYVDVLLELNHLAAPPPAGTELVLPR